MSHTKTHKNICVYQILILYYILMLRHKATSRQNALVTQAIFFSSVGRWYWGIWGTCFSRFAGVLGYENDNHIQIQDGSRELFFIISMYFLTLRLRSRGQPLIMYKTHLNVVICCSSTGIAGAPPLAVDHGAAAPRWVQQRHRRHAELHHKGRVPGKAPL